MTCDTRLRQNNHVRQNEGINNENTKPQPTTTQIYSKQIDKYILNNSDCYQIIFVSNKCSLTPISLAVLLDLFYGLGIYGIVFTKSFSWHRLLGGYVAVIWLVDLYLLSL